MLYAMHASASRLTVCIPAHNEAATLGRAIALVKRSAARSHGLVADIMVVDDRSTDGSGDIARSAGARVITTAEECKDFGGSRGKGDAIWSGLRRCETDLIAFIDADVTSLSMSFVKRLSRPLLQSPDIHLVKGRFRRASGHEPTGRVTMLTARPLITLLHPRLSHLHEPLSGVFAGRVETLGQLWLDCDYGVDVGILLDVAHTYGEHSICEVDLGRLEHRYRDLASLTVTAQQVARAIVARASATDLIHDDVTVRRIPPRWGIRLGVTDQRPLADARREK